MFILPSIEYEKASCFVLICISLSFALVVISLLCAHLLFYTRDDVVSRVPNLTPKWTKFYLRSLNKLYDAHYCFSVICHNLSLVMGPEVHCGKCTLYCGSNC